MPKPLQEHGNYGITPVGGKYKSLSGLGAMGPFFDASGNPISSQQYYGSNQGTIYLPSEAENYVTGGPDQLSQSEVWQYFGYGPNAVGMTSNVSPVTNLPLNISLASSLGVSGAMAKYIIYGGIGLVVGMFLLGRSRK